MYKTAWRIVKLTPILIAIEDCLCGPAFVRGRSMQPTLNPGDGNSNDLVLADKWSIKLYRYRRGDVVLLRYIDPVLRELLHCHHSERSGPSQVQLQLQDI